MKESDDQESTFNRELKNALIKLKLIFGDDYWVLSFARVLRREKSFKFLDSPIPAFTDPNNEIMYKISDIKFIAEDAVMIHVTDSKHAHQLKFKLWCDKRHMLEGEVNGISVKISRKK